MVAHASYRITHAIQRNDAEIGFYQRVLPPPPADAPQMAMMAGAVDNGDDSNDNQFVVAAGAPWDTDTDNKDNDNDFNQKVQRLIDQINGFFDLGQAVSDKLFQDLTDPRLFNFAHKYGLVPMPKPEGQIAMPPLADPPNARLMLSVEYTFDLSDIGLSEQTKVTLGAEPFFPALDWAALEKMSRKNL